MAFSFDGADDCVEYAHNARLDVGAADFCIVIKVKGAGGATDRWFSKGTASGGIGNGVRYELYDNTSTSFRFAIDDNVTKLEAEMTSGEHRDATWHTWFFERDYGSTLKIYMDGNTEKATINDTSGNLDNGNSLVIMGGRGAGDTITWFALGTIAEFALFKRLLTGAEKDAMGKGHIARPLNPSFYVQFIADTENYDQGIVDTIHDAPVKAPHPRIIEEGSTRGVWAIPAGAAIIRSVSDTLGITDDINTKIGYSRSIDDGIGITDVIAKIGTYIRTLVDNLASTDSINTAIGLKKSIDDGVGISDTVNASIFKLASLADNLGITDVITRTGNFIRSIPDTLGITDAITVIKSFVRSIDDGLGITDILTSEKFILATLADTLGITDTLSIIGTYVRSVADGIGITDIITKIGTYKRSITDTEAITDTVITSSGKVRTLSDNIGITDILSAIVGKVTVIADTLGITDAITFIKITVIAGRVFIAGVAKSLRISGNAKSLRVSGEEKSLRIKGSSED